MWGGIVMFYQKYVELCAQRQKSPTAVAVELGISRASVSGWKKGSVPRDAIIWRIADYFHIEPDFFYDDYEQKEMPSDPISDHEDISKYLAMLSPENLDYVKSVIAEKIREQLQV